MKTLITMAFWLLLTAGIVARVFGMQSNMNGHGNPHVPKAPEAPKVWPKARDISRVVPQPIYPTIKEAYFPQIVPPCK